MLIVYMSISFALSSPQSRDEADLITVHGTVTQQTLTVWPADWVSNGPKGVLQTV